ncbi:serine/threonine-protein kinase [Streptomyces litchfieldiae]|uniref:Serine/threonine-protein kinase n=1 Tax=Streptomyces litchfieldiae TaxID=3075543 RepID=A0ABU2MJL0_9ACTN|nr:serine/threonine-protein kinase [Streptomyces sp. DSM 44938]MDT0341294.1 serine/threonine-protein kinase [Streptomyces sp. DSM 44938]
MEALNPEDPSAIGPYRLLGRLGEGGMGRVFLGRSPSGRMVAVKVVHSELAREPHFRRRFRAEVDAARRVTGMWTAPVLDHDIESPVPWVATGYVVGSPLREVVDSLHGPLPERSVWALAYGLASALLAVHGNGLIHRDLKPSNVMVTLEGPKVIDFGIARSVDASVVTRTGGMVGSPGYMPPEQIRGDELTGAADVFALGAVLAYAATGMSPFSWDGAPTHTVMHRVLNEAPHLGPEDGRLKGDLRTLVLHCLLKDASERPPLAGIPPFARRRAGNEYWLPSGLTARLGQVAANLLAFEGPEADRPPSSWGPQPPSARDPQLPPASSPSLPSASALPSVRPGQTTIVPGGFGMSPAPSSWMPQNSPPSALPAPPAPPAALPPPPTRTPATSPWPRPSSRRRGPARYALAAAAGVVALSLATWLIVANVAGGDDDPRAGGTSEGTSDDANAERRSLIGDPRTADVCALTNTDAFAEFGLAETDVDYGNFHVCELHIRDGDTRIDVQTYLRRGGPPEGSQPADPIGTIGVVEAEPKADECGRVLLPPDDGADGILVGIRANLEGKGEVAGGDATLCEIADAAARSAADVLNQGPVPRRSPAYPENSLAWVNACELLGDATLANAGLDADPEAGVGDWECEWSGDTDELTAVAGFHRDQPKDGERVRLGDYDAIVESEDSGDECTVFLEYRGYDGQNAERAVEMLRLRVEGQRPVEDLCELARELTSSAADRLPAR